MRILICLLPLLVAAAPVPDPPGDKCLDAKLHEAKRDTAVTVHPLNREPGAKQEIAVLHYDARRCVEPIVVRDNVGGKSQ
ncbi:MAG: hypothetical protein ACTHM0_04000 [Sphingomonas sp.]